MSKKQIDIYRTGIYLRLSQGDEDIDGLEKKESNSISNQKLLLEGFIGANDDLKLVDIFIDAGCAFNTPSCGPCMGGHMGVMAAGEKCVSTTNRNFVGRMGHVDSLIYLASPEVAAASAIAGYIANPEKVGDR